MATVRKNRTNDTKVRVSLREKSYDVVIGKGAIERLDSVLKTRPSKRAFLISDERLTSQRKAVIEKFEKLGWQITEYPVAAGEALKNFETLFPVYAAMLKAGIDRSSLLVALGGGSVGDAAGFVASTYLRGIAWLGLPTTLLAQVDSAIGGKTAVNHAAGKNLIGTFHQPMAVVCDTRFLETLSKREIISGLGEVLKYGLTFDPKFFKFVNENWSRALALDENVLTKMIKASAGFKAKAVSQDEFDRKGKREVLNFGHTFGHAIESVTNYQGFQHGEAVLWGMRFAAALSLIRKKLSRKSWAQIDQAFKQIELPPLPKNVSPEAYFKPMSKDKKAFEGKVRFVLLKEIGETVSDKNVSEADLRKALQMLES